MQLTSVMFILKKNNNIAAFWKEHAGTCGRAPMLGSPVEKTRAQLALMRGGGVSRSCSPAEQHGHLLIRHALLQSHSHRPAQVDGQDVFALPEKIADRLNTRGPA